MHIVQLANFAGSTSGGLRVVLEELGTHYVDRGHRVTRIVPGESSGRLTHDGVEVIQVAAPLVPGMGGYRAITCRGRIERLLAALRPDVVELSDKTTLVGATRPSRASGVPVVLISHERIDAILADRFPRWFPLTGWADRWNARLAGCVDAVVCASEFAAEEFRRIGFPSVCRVPLGVDLAVFDPKIASDATAGNGATGAARMRPESGSVIVCVGRLSTEKRPMTALATLRRLHQDGHPVSLTLVGDGPARHRLEQMAATLPVSFAGHVADRRTLAALLRAADVAIAPCPHETFGLSSLEALASGTPIVVPNAGALVELVVPGAGLAVSDDPASFADGVVRLLEGDRHSQRLAARRRAEAFGWNHTAEAMEALFDRLVWRRRLAFAAR